MKFAMEQKTMAQAPDKQKLFKMRSQQLVALGKALGLTLNPKADLKVLVDAVFAEQQKRFLEGATPGKPGQPQKPAAPGAVGGAASGGPATDGAANAATGPQASDATDPDLNSEISEGDANDAETSGTGIVGEAELWSEGQLAHLEEMAGNLKAHILDEAKKLWAKEKAAMLAEIAKLKGLLKTAGVQVEEKADATLHGSINDLGKK